jgi:hypothetical protein
MVYKDEHQSEGNATAPLPEPPAGYSWARAIAARAIFLRPYGWHFKSVEQPPVLDYLITKEPLPPDNTDAMKLISDLAIKSMEQGQYSIRVGGLTQFETGISIGVWGYVSQVKGMCPSEYAKAYSMKLRCQSPELIIEDTWSPQLAPFMSLGVQFRYKEKRHSGACVQTSGCR